MEKSVQITLIIVAGFVILGMMYGFVNSNLPNSNENTITETGQAKVNAMPDLVKVYFQVETTASTSEEATTKNSEIVQNLKNSLTSKGFEESEIQTQGFNVYPEYNWNSGQQTFKHYKATHTLVLELPTSKSSQIGTAIDAGVEAGAGISYINFELSQEKQNEYKKEALKLAAEDAKLKAEAVAEGLDKRLGSLISVSDNNFGYTPWRLYDSGGVVASAEQAKTAVTDINPSEEEISASVTATFKIR